MKAYKQKSGLTLIELMVTIVAASVLILTVVLILVMTFRSWRINNAYVALRRNAAFATSQISRDIRESTLEDIFVSPGQLSLNPLKNGTVTYTKNGDALSSSAFGLIIPHGLKTFSAQTNALGDGVEFTLILTNSINHCNIASTNTAFVNTRN